MKLQGDRHLTYCTNIHPGETWAEVRRNLETLVLPVRERVAADRPFGLGLRLSGEAARTLSHAEPLAEFRSFLAEHGLYLFTINGFPYGPFHGRPVKEAVYLPDWLDPERLRYTNQLADILAALLPDGVDGTISTVPGAFASRVTSSADVARMAAMLARHVAHLVWLRQATGRRIALALEPEPCCFLETTEQTVAFFREHLFGAAAVDVLAGEAGLTRPAAEAALREHVGVCLDACHLAVEFEDAAAALNRLRDAGIRIPKVQISAGLGVALAPNDEATRRALAAFADDVYLHQVVERRADGGLARYTDLPDALAAAEREPHTARDWRIHFHVPLFRERLGRFHSTQPYTEALLRMAAQQTDCAHWEVETYTWDVLPAEFRAEGIVAAVAREMAWAAERLPP